MRALLASLVLLIVSSVTSFAETRVALVIGNGDYRAAPSLANPGSDATAVADALERLGFKVVLGLDQDIRAMRRTIRDFSTVIEGADLALFYYAGHGVQVAGQNYLLPVDADLKRESDLDFTAIDISLILRQMERSAKTKILLLDACRNNPFETALTRSMGATRSVRALGRGLAPIRAEGGALIGFATDPGDVALDGEGDHSPFTKALLSHIETPNLEVNVLMTRVRADVYEATNQRQRPWTTTSLIGEVYLNAETVEVNIAPATGPADLELALWQAVSNSTSASDYEAYLEQFPEGTFAGLARNRIASLTPAAPAPDPLAEQIKQPSGLAAPLGVEEDHGPAGKPLEATPETGTATAALANPSGPAALPGQLPEPDVEPAGKPGIETASARIPTPRPALPEPEPALVPDPGTLHRDCPLCPDMVAVPGGTFVMGSPRGEGSAEERPARKVDVPPFLMARTETTLGDYSAFVAASGHKVRAGCYLWTPAGRMRETASATATALFPDDPARDRLPAACVSWADADAYVSWLNDQVQGTPYRLPSEAEFEYALRAGSDSPYPWGANSNLVCTAGNGADAASRFKWRNQACKDGYPDLAPVGAYPANPFGLHDLVGNLWEWTADCWNGSYRGAPSDARARDTGTCSSRVLRGGSWDDPVKNLRSAYRVGIPYQRRQQNVGFRVVRDPLP